MPTAAAAKLAPAAAAAASRSSLLRLPSVSFSGAGFLGCYHMGAAACLLDHGHLLRPGEVPRDDEDGVEDDNKSIEASGAAAAAWPPTLTGVSAGAIVSAAVSAGVRPDDGMSVVLEVSRRTRQRGGALDVLRPGFSLVDQVEDLLSLSMKRALGGTGDTADDYDVDLFRRRTRGGRNLRIGLSDKRVVGTMFQLHSNPDAYRYVDEFRDVDDAVAACILSSYIPGMTGTVKGAACPHNDAVRRSWDRIRAMEQLGFVKYGTTGQPVVNTMDSEAAEGGKRDNEDDKCPDLYYWDGGLSDVFPTIDTSTVVVSPINGLYSNPSIAPALPAKPIDELDDRLIHETQAMAAGSGPIGKDTSSDRDPDQPLPPKELVKGYFSVLPKTVRAHAVAKLGVNRANAETLLRMVLSSDDSVLQERFSCGYDDARRFLSERDMLNVFS